MNTRALRSIFVFAVVCLVFSATDVAFAQTTTPDILNTPISGSVASWIIRTFGLLTILYFSSVRPAEEGAH